MREIFEPGWEIAQASVRGMVAPVLIFVETERCSADKSPARANAKPLAALFCPPLQSQSHDGISRYRHNFFLGLELGLAGPGKIYRGQGIELVFSLVGQACSLGGMSTEFLGGSECHVQRCRTKQPL